MPDEKSKLVYSTDKTIPLKKKSVEKTLPVDRRPKPQKLTVRLDWKGRKGKSVTVVEGLQMPQNGIETLLKQLKARFGTGGTVRDTGFEIQGDHCEGLITALETMGYTSNRSGKNKPF